MRVESESIRKPAIRHDRRCLNSPDNNPNCDSGTQNDHGVSTLPGVAGADTGFESVVVKSGTFASIPVLARIYQWSEGTSDILQDVAAVVRVDRTASADEGA